MPLSHSQDEDWFEQALTCVLVEPSPVVASQWSDDDDGSDEGDLESGDHDSDDGGDIPLGDDKVVEDDPFDDFDDEDFDDDFDDDFEEELEDDYEIEPDDSEMFPEGDDDEDLLDGDSEIMDEEP